MKSVSHFKVSNLALEYFVIESVSQPIVIIYNSSHCDVTFDMVVIVQVSLLLAQWFSVLIFVLERCCSLS